MSTKRTHWHFFRGFRGCIPEERSSHWNFSDAWSEAMTAKNDSVETGERWPGLGKPEEVKRNGGTIVDCCSPTRTEYIQIEECSDEECDPDHCGDDYYET